ncbi:hypothetical protein AVEN_133660-1 [Araneus ventricosus]|uniref:Uncharacterized protein n=1 Tax=Araneus ventricosus TaxID=182803 RepID=A0A4Y2MP08_ARAVE|nr:hypothetical protein AVEN_133660-1 [Araneus ventricosus]
MGFAMNIFTEALLFSEDLLIDFMHRNKISWTPATSGNTYRHCVQSKFTPAIGNAVSNLSKLPLSSMTFAIYGKVPYFPRGYNPRDFLHYCAVLATAAADECDRGNDEFADEVVLSIARYLKEMKGSGEFNRKGGWSAIQQEGAESCVHWQRQTIRNLETRIGYSK